MSGNEAYESIDSHRVMALDDVRNGAYAEALAGVVVPGSVVLDLGAGVGIFGLLAAKLGAGKVYCVEPEDVIEVCRENVARNGFADRIECLQGTIEDVDLPEQVDVIVSALTGNLLLNEDLLPSLFLARDRHLKAGGVLLPSAAELAVVPVAAAELHERRVGAWSRLQLGVDLSAGRSYAANTVYYPGAGKLATARHLAPACDLLAWDFRACGYDALDASAEFRCTSSGLCHGLVGWFRIQLGARWLSTAPSEPKTHWSPAFLPLDPPVEVEAGDTLELRLQRPPRGEWTWTVDTGGVRRRASTFLASPISPASLAEASGSVVPRIAEEGRAVRRALELCDGSTAIAEVAATLRREFPELLTGEDEAFDFVRRLVRSYGRG